MKKVLTLILTLSLLLCPLGVSAAEPELQTAYGYAKLLNFGEFPEKPEYEEGIATASIPQYNSAAGATANTSESALQEIHEYLRECLINCDEQIPLYYYSEDYELEVIDTGKIDEYGDPIYICENLNKLITETTNYYPELFHVYKYYSYNFYYSSTTKAYVYALKPFYVNPDNRSQIYSNQATAKAAYDTALKKYNNDIDRIISGITPEMTDLEKALYVHDYIVTHFKYDSRGCSNVEAINKLAYRDAYSFFKTGEGVCQAYTQAFNGIMHRLGIECTSALDDKDNHTWNIITLNGNNYHIDATQDDPLGYSAGSAKHTYFLLSDNTIKTIDDELNFDPNNPEKDVNSHEEWYTAMYKKVTCDDNKYESGYAWNEADSSFEYVDGYWYYINFGDNFTSSICRTKDFINSVAVSDSFNTRIPVPDKPGYYYANFGSVSSVGNTLYYSAPDQIYFYNAENGTNGQIDIATSSENSFITSCRYDGNGILTVFLGSSPYSNDDGGSTPVTLFNIGDTDGDGNVSSTDVATTKRYLLGSKTDFNWATIDFGNKKHVNILDLIKIKKLAAVA